MGVWREPQTIDAIRGYVRIAFGAAFAAILLYMLLTGKIDPIAVLKAISAVLALGRTADGALLLMAHKSGTKTD